MSASRAATAATDLARLARSIDEAALARRLDRCREDRAGVIVIEGAAPPAWLRELVGDRPRIDLVHVEVERERVLRAGRALIVLEAGTTLGAGALDTVQWLFRCRPPGSTASVFFAAAALPAADRARLATRARKTVGDDLAPPGRGVALADEGIFLLEPATADASPSADRAALAHWLAGAPAPARACDRLALAPLLVELEQALDRQRKPSVPRDQSISPKAAADVRDRILDRIDRAHDEIETTIRNEATRFGRIVATEIAASMAAKPSRAAFAAALGEATAAMDRRIAVIARECDADLKGAIEDELALIAASPPAFALREWLARDAIFAGLAGRLRGGPAGSAAPGSTAEGGAIDKLLVASVALAACALPASPGSLIPIAVAIGALGVYRSPAVKELLGTTLASRKTYDMLADSMRERARDSFARLHDELGALRRKARDDVIRLFAVARGGRETPAPPSAAASGRATFDAIIADLDL